MTLSHDLVACIGEFVGTFLFLFLAEGGAKTASMTANAVSAASSSPIALVDSQTLVYVSLSFGLSLTVVAWMFFRVSGSLFNPAISLALLLAGALPWRRCILLVIAQFAGGIAANGMVEALTPTFGHSNITTLAPGVSVTQGIFLEAILTAALVFSVLMLAAEKHRATYLAPVGIGLTLFVCHLFGALWTGAAMNPARALGPSVIQRSFPNYHYVYYVGPFLGSLFALAFYIILKACDYSKAVMGQDADSQDGPGAVSIPAAMYGRARSVSTARRTRKAGGKPTVIQLGSGETAVQIPASALEQALAAAGGDAGAKEVDLEAQKDEVDTEAKARTSTSMSRGTSHFSHRLSLHLPGTTRTSSIHTDATTFADARSTAPVTLAREASHAGTFIIVPAPEESSVVAEAQSSGAMLAPGSTEDGLARVGILKDVLSQ